MAQRYTGLSNKEIGERFGGIEGSGISKAASRAKEEIVSDKQLSKLVRKLDSSFKAWHLCSWGALDPVFETIPKSEFFEDIEAFPRFQKDFFADL